MYDIDQGGIHPVNVIYVVAHVHDFDCNTQEVRLHKPNLPMTGNQSDNGTSGRIPLAKQRIQNVVQYFVKPLIYALASG